jgi:hypothetical protein
MTRIRRQIVLSATATLLIIHSLLQFEAHAAEGDDLKLSISTSGALLKPTVTSFDAKLQCCVVRKDASTNRWVTTLTPVRDRLVTSYKIASGERDVVAIRLDLPSALEHTSQSVLLRSTNLHNVHERTIAEYFSTKEPLKDPLSEVFGYLQDLHFVVTEQMNADPSSSISSNSAPRTRAAFMLLQTVQRLAENTWYVVHPDYEASIKFSVSILASAHGQGRDCGWLGYRACMGVPLLLKSVQRLQGIRLKRMYSLIVPDAQKELDRELCTTEKIRTLDYYYDYFVSQIDSLTAADIRSGSGISEIRIAKALAACSVVEATCHQQDPDDQQQNLSVLQHALDRLRDAKARYLEPSEQASVANRISDVEHIVQEATRGAPLYCSRP